MLTPDRLQIPPNFEVHLAADTGTFMSALFVAISRDQHAVVLEEIPNYHYVADQIAPLDLANPEWARQVVESCTRYRIRPRAWADPNTQFRRELKHYGLHLRPNENGPEVRTSIAREWVNQGRVHFTPWLKVLPYELEHAQWPDAGKLGDRFERLRTKDHTLVCLEHILSRRPRTHRPSLVEKTKTFLERYLDEHKWERHTPSDPHLGAR